MTHRRAGVGALVIGVVGILAAQRISPVAAPPLFDGVVVVEPYRWLVPASGAPGAPTSDGATIKLVKGQSPTIALATSEEPPQAQIFLVPGALVLPPGTTSIHVSIAPILPQTLPTTGHIHGNVYRISVTNQAGIPLATPASFRSSVTIRGPGHETNVTMERLDFDGWKPLKTLDAGFGQTFVAVVTAFGDFALVTPGPGGPYPTATPVPGAATAAASDGQPSVSPGAASPAAQPTPEPSVGGADAAVGLPVGFVVGPIALAILGVAGLVWSSRRSARRP